MSAKGSWPCGSFRLEVLLKRIPAVLGGSATADGRSEDYALITAMSGWTPMMVMTRVRL
jgi:hypothetical protein